MNLVILGATGGTGIEVLRQAVQEGHTVTAIVRSPDRLKRFRDRVQIKQGNLLNRTELADALQGHEAILSAFGPRLPVSQEDHDLLYRFSIELTAAMQKAKVERLIIESSAFLFRDALFPPAYLVGRIFFPQVVADATAMEETIRHSGFRWTIVRPPRLTDGAHTGRYRQKEGHLPPFGFSISRADVADCFLKLLGETSSIHKIVGVSH